MFPFGIFPFNVLPQFNPWWPIQSQQNLDSMPPMFKLYMENYAAWMEMMTKGNPWLASCTQIMQDMQKAAQQPPKK